MVRGDLLTGYLSLIGWTIYKNKQDCTLIGWGDAFIVRESLWPGITALRMKSAPEVNSQSLAALRTWVGWLTTGVEGRPCMSVGEMQLRATRGAHLKDEWGTAPRGESMSESLKGVECIVLVNACEGYGLPRVPFGNLPVPQTDK